MSKIMILLGLYGFTTFCEINENFPIAEILMPKLEEHASNRTFSLSGETLSGESDEDLYE